MTVYSITVGFTDADTGQTFKTGECFRDRDAAFRLIEKYLDHNKEAMERGEMIRFFVGLERRVKHEGESA